MTHKKITIALISTVLLFLIHWNCCAELNGAIENFNKIADFEELAAWSCNGETPVVAESDRWYGKSLYITSDNNVIMYDISANSWEGIQICFDVLLGENEIKQTIYDADKNAIAALTVWGNKVLFESKEKIYEYECLLNNDEWTSIAVCIDTNSSSVNIFINGNRINSDNIFLNSKKILGVGFENNYTSPIALDEFSINEWENAFLNAAVYSAENILSLYDSEKYPHSAVAPLFSAIDNAKKALIGIVSEEDSKVLCEKLLSASEIFKNGAYADGVVIFEDDFNSGKASGYLQAKDLKFENIGAGNTAIYMQSQNSRILRALNEEMTGTVKVEFDFMQADKNTIYSICNPMDKTGNYHVCRIDSDGTNIRVIFGNGSSETDPVIILNNYDENKWYHFQLIADALTNSVKVKIDNNDWYEGNFIHTMNDISRPFNSQRKNISGSGYYLDNLSIMRMGEEGDPEAFGITIHGEDYIQIADSVQEEYSVGAYSIVGNMIDSEATMELVGSYEGISFENNVLTVTNDAEDGDILLRATYADITDEKIIHIFHKEAVNILPLYQNRNKIIVSGKIIPSEVKNVIVMCKSISEEGLAAKTVKTNYRGEFYCELYLSPAVSTQQVTISIDADGLVEETLDFSYEGVDIVESILRELHTADFERFREILTKYTKHLGIDTFENYLKDMEMCYTHLIETAYSTQNEFLEKFAEIDFLIGIKHSVPSTIEKLVDTNWEMAVSNGANDEFKNSKYKIDILLKVYGKEYKSINVFTKELNDLLSSAKNAEKSDKSGGTGGGIRSTISATDGGSRKSAVSPIDSIFNVQKADSENSVETNISNFDDLEGYEWAAEAINYLKSLNIITGIGNNKFAPERAVSREEFAKMLVLAFELDEKSETRFEDVSPEAWYYNYISVCAGCKIIEGISETKFGTGMEITREEAAVMLCRVAKYRNIPLLDGNESKFADSEQISDWALPAVLAAEKNGIFVGNEYNCFMPKKTLTRAQAAQIICFVMQYEKGE